MKRAAKKLKLSWSVMNSSSLCSSKMTWFRDDWLMTQSVRKRYDESENSSNSEIDIDFNWAHSSLLKSLQNVKINIWQKIEKDAVWETTNSISIIVKFCIFVIYWWLEISWKNLIWCDNCTAWACINLSDIELMKR